MFNKIIKGHSFKGCAGYLLHGSDGKQQDRVEFTATRNLLTENPEIAWRAMVATSRSQAQLKRDAGGSMVGNKSNKHVLHLVLSFHPDENGEVDPDLMLEAADGALDTLKAGGHQALIVAHSDTDHPHLHLLVNRVNPVTGKILSSSMDRIRMSKWAQKWEEKHGVYTEKRIINNAAREGEYIRSKGVPIHLAKASGRPVNDNDRDEQATKLRDQEQEKNGKIAREQAEVKARQQKKWEDLQRAYRVRKAKLKAEVRLKVAAAKKPVKVAWRQKRAELYHETKAEIAAYRKREKTWLGRLTNSVDTGDLMAMMRGEKKIKAITGVFTRLVSPAARFQRKLYELAEQEKAILGKQKAQERAAARAVLEQPGTKAAWSELGIWYQVQRAELSLACSAEDAQYRARWRKRAHDRQAEWAPVREAEQEKKAKTERARKRKPRKERKPRTPRVKASDVLPKEGAKDAAKMMNEHEKRMRRRVARRKRDRDRGDERER